MIIEKILKPILDGEYNKGYKAGINAQKLKDREDQNRRLHDMYHYGYIIGKSDAETEHGIVDIDALLAIADEEMDKGVSE